MGFEQIKVELQEWMGSDQAIANAAWTSTYNKSTRDLKTDEQVADLVRRCARDGHAVPFESVVFRFWFRWPIFTDRQHMTHRIASQNGLSGRYRTVPTDYYDLPDEVMEIFNKAGDKDQTLWIKVLKHDLVPFPNLVELYYESSEITVSNYKTGIDFLKLAEKEGRITNAEFRRAREIWRGQMPQAAMVERTTIINLRSFANYQRLRNSEHAQPEIRHAAQEMLRLVKEQKICPVAIEALEQKGWSI